MSRELRKVTSDWQHPINDKGHYIPMFNEYYGDALAKWIKENEMWDNGTHPDLIKRPELKENYPFYIDYYGNAPEIESYRREKWEESQLTHIQLYENTSEGTPISPLFPKDNLMDLCKFASKNCTTFADFKATPEQWYDMLSKGFVHHTQGNVTFF